MRNYTRDSIPGGENKESEAFHLKSSNVISLSFRLPYIVIDPGSCLLSLYLLIFYLPPRSTSQAAHIPRMDTKTAR